MASAVETVDFKLPDVGEGIDGAEIVAWQVTVGDRVSEHQPLVEVETDKAIVVVPSPVEGTVAELCFAVGERPAVGEVIVRLAPTGGGTGAGAGAIAVEDDAPAPAVSPVPAPLTLGPPAANADDAAPGARPLASPATRKLARELGVELAAVRGSGRAGRISRADVEAAAQGGEPSDPPPVPVAAAGGGPGEAVPLRGVRRAIAVRLSQAWQEVPHVIDYREVDAGTLLATRGRLKERARARGDEGLAAALSLTPILIKLVCAALADHPYVNASIDMEAETITLHEQLHVGIATATPEGLMVPVLHDAGAKSIGEIAVEVAELAGAARERRLRPEQLQGATFTVNNFGALGIWLGTPIVTPPQVANLGIGRLEERPVVRDGEVVVRPIFALSVSGDHRVLDGATLAAFVGDVCALTEDPAQLLERLR